MQYLNCYCASNSLDADKFRSPLRNSFEKSVNASPALAFMSFQSDVLDKYLKSNATYQIKSSKSNIVNPTAIRDTSII